MAGLCEGGNETSGSLKAKYAIRKVQDNRQGLELNGLHQLLVYADDVNMLGENPQTNRENVEILVEASKAIGLKVNLEKTKYMIISRDQNIVRNGTIKIGDLSFEEVEKFKYLGATVTNTNDTREEIKRRINMRNACYYSVEKLLSSSLLSKNLKVRIYKTVILPVVLYGCETCTLTLREEQRLTVFENKVLRKIFGAKRDEVTGECRKLHNAELHALYSSPVFIFTFEMGRTCSTKLKPHTKFNRRIRTEADLCEGGNEPAGSLKAICKVEMDGNYNFIRFTRLCSFFAFDRVKPMNIGYIINEEKHPVRSKIIINNTVIEQVSHFKYLGCDITYDYDKDVNIKTQRFQAICGTIARNLKKKTRKETQIKFYKTMAIPSLLYGCEAWTLKKNDINRIQSAEMKFLRGVKGCTRLDRYRNDDIRNELNLLPIIDKIKEYRIRWSNHLRRMDKERIPKQVLDYKPQGRRNIGRPRTRWKVEDGTGDSPTP
ncbi:hypothetical protein ANN_07618 [Periplaneta americana]|uniref:Reverse transcriptase domain-containing protein n=1 Tax=Periplaneta americana TaxID=6978 RepID=A0ABQ8SZ35_PERAM|nr:hypothetical protein ANN_07618 [Periplaneta americana]